LLIVINLIFSGLGLGTIQALKGSLYSVSDVDTKR